MKKYTRDDVEIATNLDLDEEQQDRLAGLLDMLNGDDDLDESRSGDEPDR